MSFSTSATSLMPNQRHTTTQNTPKPREIGVNPSELVGKVLKHVQRSRNHPSVTLHFTDNTVYQILVDGYNPVHRGLPKDLEMDSGLEPILNPADGRCDVNLTLTNATVITMVDKAFQLGERESQWDQQHSALALRFAEDNQWHCVWATLMDWERDESGESRCVFRSYHDVYVNTFQPSVLAGAHTAIFQYSCYDPSLLYSYSPSVLTKSSMLL
ncbi:hypothetical protein BKA93DRAFT_814084 [Sparassis latifolia]